MREERDEGRGKTNATPTRVVEPPQPIIIAANVKAEITKLCGWESG